jgi:hypothetical protein
VTASPLAAAHLSVASLLVVTTISRRPFIFHGPRLGGSAPQVGALEWKQKKVASLSPMIRKGQKLRLRSV